MKCLLHDILFGFIFGVNALTIRATSFDIIMQLFVLMFKLSRSSFWCDIIMQPFVLMFKLSRSSF